MKVRFRPYIVPHKPKLSPKIMTHCECCGRYMSSHTILAIDDAQLYVDEDTGKHYCGKCKTAILEIEGKWSEVNGLTVLAKCGPVKIWNSPVQALLTQTCVNCGSRAREFNSYKMHLRYLASGLCQKCQDEFFGDHPDEEHDGRTKERDDGR